MLQVLHMGIHASQLMGYGQIKQSMDLITTNSAKTMHIEDRYGIEVGKPANLIVLNAQNEFDAIRKQRSEEHTSELQSRGHLVCRLLLEKKNTSHEVNTRIR